MWNVKCDICNYSAIPSYLIFRIIVWKWYVRSCFLRKNGGQRRPSAAIFPQKAAPHTTSLSHYNTKYQITRNSCIETDFRASKMAGGGLFVKNVTVTYHHGVFPLNVLASFLFSVHCSPGKLFYVHCYSTFSVLRNNYSVFTVLT